MDLNLSVEESERLDALLRVIEELDPDAELPGGESNETLDAVERKLGRPVPAQLREWLRTVGGGASLVGGSLRTYAVQKAPRVPGPYLATARNALRSREWVVPDEVVPFGADSGGDVFGIWSPAGRGSDRPLVVLIGAGDGAEDVPSCAVVGEDLYGFLAGWFAHYVYAQHEEQAEEVQDLLGLPLDLQGIPDEIARSPGLHLQACLRWSSPTLPELRYDPDHGWPMSVEGVRELAGTPIGW